MDFFAMLAVHGIFIFCIFSVIFGIMLFIQELPKIWCTFIVFVLTMVCAMNKVQPIVAILIFVGNCIIVIGILKFKEKRDKKEKLKEESFREEYLAREQLKREEREEKERIRLAEEQRQKEEKEAQEQREREEREKQERIRLAQEQRQKEEKVAQEQREREEREEQERIRLAQEQREREECEEQERIRLAQEHRQKEEKKAQEQREREEREEQERIRLLEEQQAIEVAKQREKERLQLEQEISTYYMEFSAISMDSTSPYGMALKNFYQMNHLLLQEILSNLTDLESLFSLFIEKIQSSNFEFFLNDFENIRNISPLSMRFLGYSYIGHSSYIEAFRDGLTEREFSNEKNIDLFISELDKFSNLLEKEYFLTQCNIVELKRRFIFIYCLGMGIEYYGKRFSDSHSVPANLSTSIDNFDNSQHFFHCLEDKISEPEENKELLSCFYYCVAKGLLPSKEYPPVELYTLFTASYKEKQKKYLEKAEEERRKQEEAELQKEELEYKKSLFSSAPPQTVNQPVILSEKAEFTKEKRKSLTSTIMNQIDQMDGLEFESFVCKLFKAKGYYATVTSGSHDQGVDVIANLNGEKIGIQAKRYSSPVSNKAIQEIVGAKNLYQLSSLMVITNNQFTKSAIELGDSNNVMMWNREKLREEIFDNAHLLNE